MYCCKYCGDESESYEGFISPCCCIGSNQFVHKECLNAWLNTNKNNDKYKKCTECKCEFKRSYDNDINDKIQHHATLAVSFYEVFGFSITTLLLFLIQLFDNIASYLFLILYLITLSYITLLVDERHHGWCVIFLILTLMLIPKKYNKQFCSLWVIIVFMIFSYHTMSDGFMDIYSKFSMTLPKDEQPKMYDFFTNRYVDGIM